jgi:Glycosyl transferase family 2
MAPLSIVIFSRGAGKQQYGLGQDARLLELTFRELSKTHGTQGTIIHKDPYMYVGSGLPEPADVHIHVEVPCKAAFPWAKVNIVIPNPEWWYKEAWSWVPDEPSVFFLHRSRHSEKLFGKVRGAYVGWRCPVVDPVLDGRKDQVLYIVGGSANKQKAASVIVDAWLPEYPPLIVVSSEKGLPKENVRWMTRYITEEEKLAIQEQSKYHCVASAAEGFGYTMAEAISCGAQPLWTDLPVYREHWSEVLGSVGCIETGSVGADEMLDGPRLFTKEAVCAAMDSLLKNPIDSNRLRRAGITLTKEFRTHFAAAWNRVTGIVRKSEVAISKPVALAELPVIGVVTLVYNRPQWFYHAFRNIETSTYPRDKLVWVIVDDGEKRVDSMVERVRQGLPDLNVQYVSLPRRLTIGEKRNKGCSAALALRQDLSAFVFMDDDDHYPPDSLTIRTSWLVSTKAEAAACSVLPMYDLRHYISAVNVPPLLLAPCKRVSEATLCFTKKFWQERQFSKTNVGEGEEFLAGRAWTEIPPEGVIVSFLHGKNSTSRRIPDVKEPNGCHYGFTDEYFSMIHQIASLV